MAPIVHEPESSEKSVNFRLNLFQSFVNFFRDGIFSESLSLSFPNVYGMEKSYVCPRCGNADPRYIGYRNGKPYCRKCISFSGREVQEKKKDTSFLRLSLSYPLSQEQEKIAKGVLKNLQAGHDSLIYAVTGAGKTELVYASVEYVLKRNGNVGFAVPRRDVVLDLEPRFKSAFKGAKVVTIIGNHTKVLNGDILLLTTHQLYRYPRFFDLLILDEIDAFPYKGNSLLQKFTLESVRGNLIFMSATPGKEDFEWIKKRKGKVFTLNKRFHRHPLPVPVYKKSPYFPLLTGMKELKRLTDGGKQVFFFVPTIELGEKISPLILLLVKGGAFVHSEDLRREEKISAFKEGKYRYLVTTSILERGVTVKGLQVIVYGADHPLYTKETLIQIAGRAGRKKEEPDGEVLFVGRKDNEAIEGAIREIQRLNREAGL